MTYPETRWTAYDKPCPLCGAKPGELCRSRRTGRSVGRHQARTVLDSREAPDLVTYPEGDE